MLKPKLLFALFALAVLAIGGCKVAGEANQDGAAPPESKTADPAVKTDPATDPAVKTDPATDPAVKTDPATDPAVKTDPAATAKCEECGTEKPQAELASHDGKKLCKKCIEAHGH